MLTNICYVLGSAVVRKIEGVKNSLNEFLYGSRNKTFSLHIARIICITTSLYVGSNLE